MQWSIVLIVLSTVQVYTIYGETLDFAPRITSHPSNSEVHSRLLLVKGTCGSNDNGSIFISAHNDNFPKQSFPVRNGHFKALIHLSSGENRIQLTFDNDRDTWTSSWTVKYIPLLQNPPLHLCIIIGSDSSLTYDDVPNATHPPTLETAIKKLRLAGYLWQAYTESQMSSNGLGHRTFRLDESWQADSLSSKDQSFRTTATVHILKSNYTIAEIRDPQRAQQNKDATNKNSLFNMALEAIRPKFSAERNYVAALFLDSHYENGSITGHAALGGGDSKHSLGIFGSHTLFSWPTSLEEVIPSFMDARPVDTKYCGIDNEGNTYWIAANVGIGAMLHEVGHAFGCPHQRSGVMMRDYIRLSRSFSVTEPPGPPALNGKECAWHRLDLLRFRAHPCFALPEDSIAEENDMQIFGIDQGILIKSASPLVVVEIYLDSDQYPKSWIEYLDQKRIREVVISQEELRNHTGTEGKIKIHVTAIDGKTVSISNVQTLLDVQEISHLGKVWRTAKLGHQSGSSSEIIFSNDPIVKVRVYSGRSLDGVEFFTNQASFFFGKRGGSPHDIILENDESIISFGVRSGIWIDALQIITNKRHSQWFGNIHGGSPHILAPPNDTNYRICGIYGDIGRWVNQIGLQYCIKQKPIFNFA